jgi:acyl carrier protein
MNFPVRVEGAAADSATVEDSLKAVVIQVLQLSLPMSTLTESTNLYELGLEPLNVVEMLAQIESEFGVVFEIEDLNAELFSTFGSLAAVVERKHLECA